MTYEQIDPAIRHCYGVHEAFRKLGFASDDIFIGAIHGIAWVVLRTQGKEFKVGAARTCRTQKEFEGLWTKTAQAIVDGKVHNDVLNRMFLEASEVKDSVRFVAAILAKGIVLPVALANSLEEAKRRASLN